MTKPPNPSLRSPPCFCPSPPLLLMMPASPAVAVNVSAGRPLGRREKRCLGIAKATHCRRDSRREKALSTARPPGFPEAVARDTTRGKAVGLAFRAHFEGNGVEQLHNARVKQWVRDGGEERKLFKNHHPPSSAGCRRHPRTNTRSRARTLAAPVCLLQCGSVSLRYAWPCPAENRSSEDQTG